MVVDLLQGDTMKRSRLVLLAWLLACIVVPLGAYVRLSAAGLGCPDWPGCYGKPTPLHAAADIAQALAAHPDGPVSLAKAWKEMVHRYFAATLGFLILCLMVRGLRNRQERLPAALLFATVVFQGLLGMWTVTLLLKPAIVTSHLLGGMTVAATLAWWAWRERIPSIGMPRSQVWLGWLLVVGVALQIALGGWVSSNYAALACQGFPTCNGAAWPELHFGQAFHLLRAPGESAEGGGLPLAGLISIHWLHRLGAALVSALLLYLVGSGWKEAKARPRLLALLAAWGLQIALGIANVLLLLPLPVAVAHNAGALLLLSVALVHASHQHAVAPSQRYIKRYSRPMATFKRLA
jgi:cytochrome c oxidase assembly protein subunit 15